MSDQNRIRLFWKPDGKTVDAEHESKMKAWLKRHAISTGPGALTVILHSPVHESVRKHLVHALSIPEIPPKGRR